MRVLYTIAICLICSVSFATDFKVYNPFTGKLDATSEANEYTDYDSTNYEIDISTTVHIGGELHGGTNEIEGWKIVYSGENLYLYLNNELVQSWYVALGGYLLTEEGDNLTTEAGEKLLWE